MMAFGVMPSRGDIPLGLTVKVSPERSHWWGNAHPISWDPRQIEKAKRRKWTQYQYPTLCSPSTDTVWPVPHTHAAIFPCHNGLLPQIVIPNEPFLPQAVFATNSTPTCGPQENGNCYSQCKCNLHTPELSNLKGPLSGTRQGLKVACWSGQERPAPSSGSLPECGAWSSAWRSCCYTGCWLFCSCLGFQKLDFLICFVFLS